MLLQTAREQLRRLRRRARNSRRKPPSTRCRRWRRRRRARQSPTQSRWHGWTKAGAWSAAWTPRARNSAVHWRTRQGGAAVADAANSVTLSLEALDGTVEANRSCRRRAQPRPISVCSSTRRRTSSRRDPRPPSTRQAWMRGHVAKLTSLASTILETSRNSQAVSKLIGDQKLAEGPSPLRGRRAPRPRPGSSTSAAHAAPRPPRAAAELAASTTREGGDAARPNRQADRRCAGARETRRRGRRRVGQRARPESDQSDGTGRRDHRPSWARWTRR